MKSLLMRWKAFQSWATTKSPYFGIVSATIVLLSWTVTTMISSRLVGARAALHKATTEDGLDLRLSSIRRKNRVIEATLSRVDLMLSEANPNSIFSTFPPHIAEHSKNTYALLQTAETGFFEHEDLQDLVNRTERLSNMSDLPETLTQELQSSNQLAVKTLTRYSNASKNWDAKRRQSIELIKAGNIDEDLFHEATTEYIEAVAPLHVSFQDQRAELQEIHGKILAHLASRLSWLAAAHRVSERLSWFLYAFGVCFAIVGKWLEIQKAKAEKEKAQE